MPTVAIPIASPAAKTAKNLRIVILLEPVSGRALSGARHLTFAGWPPGKRMKT